MALRVRIAVRAANQVRKASGWWSVNRPNAPGAIATDFGEAVALLAEQPGIGAKYGGSRTVGVRRLFPVLGISFTTKQIRTSFMCLRFGTQAGNTSHIYKLAHFGCCGCFWSSCGLAFLGCVAA